jgi:Fe-S cluster assembly iron-binding protein IscA
MLRVTPKATEEIKTMMDKRGEPGQGIRVVIQGYG